MRSRRRTGKRILSVLVVLATSAAAAGEQQFYEKGFRAYDTTLTASAGLKGFFRQSQELVQLKASDKVHVFARANATHAGAVWVKVKAPHLYGWIPESVLEGGATAPVQFEDGTEWTYSDSSTCATDLGMPLQKQSDYWEPEFQKYMTTLARDASMRSWFLSDAPARALGNGAKVEVFARSLCAKDGQRWVKVKTHNIWGWLPQRALARSNPGGPTATVADATAGGANPGDTWDTGDSQQGVSDGPSAANLDGKAVDGDSTTGEADIDDNGQPADPDLAPNDSPQRRAARKRYYDQSFQPYDARAVADTGMRGWFRDPKVALTVGAGERVQVFGRSTVQADGETWFKVATIDRPRKRYGWIAASAVAAGSAGASSQQASPAPAKKPPTCGKAGDIAYCELPTFTVAKLRNVSTDIPLRKARLRRRKFSSDGRLGISVYKCATMDRERGRRRECRYSWDETVVQIVARSKSKYGYRSYGKDFVYRVVAKSRHPHTIKQAKRRGISKRGGYVTVSGWVHGRYLEILNPTLKHCQSLGWEGEILSCSVEPYIAREECNVFAKSSRWVPLFGVPAGKVVVVAESLSTHWRMRYAKIRLTAGGQRYTGWVPERYPRVHIRKGNRSRKVTTDEDYATSGPIVIEPGRRLRKQILFVNAAKARRSDYHSVGTIPKKHHGLVTARSKRKWYCGYTYEQVDAYDKRKLNALSGWIEQGQCTDDHASGAGFNPTYKGCSYVRFEWIAPTEIEGDVRAFQLKKLRVTCNNWIKRLSRKQKKLGLALCLASLVQKKKHPAAISFWDQPLKTWLTDSNLQAFWVGVADVFVGNAINNLANLAAGALSSLAARITSRVGASLLRFASKAIGAAFFLVDLGIQTWKTLQALGHANMGRCHRWMARGFAHQFAGSMTRAFDRRFTMASFQERDLTNSAYQECVGVHHLECRLGRDYHHKVAQYAQDFRQCFNAGRDQAYKTVKKLTKKLKTRRSTYGKTIVQLIVLQTLLKPDDPLRKRLYEQIFKAIYAKKYAEYRKKP